MRNRYKQSYICIAFVLASTLLSMAKSDHTDRQQRENLQLNESDPGQSSRMIAAVGEGPVLSAANESELPDAPSASKSDASTADPTPSPVVKRNSQGAAPAAMGGPLSPDRTVADRNYLLLTGGMIGASVFNAEVTLHCLNEHPDCNDVPSSLRSRAALYGIGIPADLGVAYLTYFMKKRHSSMWYVPAAVVSGANLFFGVRAYRWAQDPPKGLGVTP